MKVLQVLPAYYPAHRYGGPTHSVRGLSRSLVRQGVEVSVFTTNQDGPQTLEVPTERGVSLEGTEVYYFPVVSPRGYFRSPRLTASLRQRVREFDLVHIHGLYLYPTMAAARVCRQQQVPYVISPRGMLDPHAFAVRSGLKKKLYLQLIERKNLEGAAALHFTSAEEQRLVDTWQLRVPGFVVPNGLNLADFPPALALNQPKSTGRADPETILFLSRIDPKKGLDLLIPAFSLVATQRPHTHLRLVGPDNDGYMARVQTLIASHGLQSRVSYEGMLVGQAKLDALLDAALLVLPSYSENFGMVVIEALACGTPVVITNRVNICQEVQQAGAGLVTTCSPAEIAEAMLTLLENPSSQQHMGRQGRHLVEHRFAWPKVAGEMVRAYQNVLQSQH